MHSGICVYGFGEARLGTRDLGRGPTSSGPQDGSGTWSTSDANWWNGTTNVVWATGNATFGTGAAGSGTAGTVALGSEVTANNITFNAPFSGTYTIDLAGRTLTVASGGSLITNANTTIADSIGTGSLLVNDLPSFGIGINNNTTLTISAKVTGSANLYTGGQGSLTLTNDANDFLGLLGKQNGGNITISSIANNGVASAAGAGNLVQIGFNSGLIYTGGGDTTNRTLELIGDASSRSATITQSGSGALIWTGTVSNTAGADGTMNVNLNGANTSDNEIQGVFANNVVGGGTNVLSMTKNDAGKWILSGANTYTGATAVTGGILQIGNGGTTGSLSGSSAISVASGATLAFSRSDTITQGTDFNSVISGAGSLTKLSSGTLVLNSGNTYTGTTAINGGTLRIVNDVDLGAFSSPTFLVNNASTLQLVQGTQGLNQVLNDKTIIFDAAGGGTFLLDAGNNLSQGSRTTTFKTTGGVQNFVTSINGGFINGQSAGIAAFDVAKGSDPSADLVSTLILSNINITKTGAGTLSFRGSNSNFPITISQGTFDVGGSATLNGGAFSAAISNSGVFQYNSSANQTLSGTITGAGSLRKLNSGTLTLTGTNTYSGASTISAGVLELGENGSFADSSSIVVGDAGSANAILDLTAKTGGFSLGDESQLLGGGGTVRLASSGTLNVLGTFSPGNSSGLFTFDGGTTILSGTTFMEILGTSRATDPSHDPGFYDAVNIINNGTLQFGGNLTLEFSSLFDNNTTFDLFTPASGSSLTGNFAGVTVIAGFYADLNWNESSGLWKSSNTAGGQSLEFSSVTGQLVIVPEPGSLVLAGCGIAAAGWVVARRRHAAS